jgi:lipid-A-disaccharide synthase-like uncharacterized protein
MNDITLIQFLLALPLLFFGLAVLGGLVKLYGIIRHRPDIF